MNQKRITNQILEQKNFTLNSTLNYLFNISNMKKLFSYLLISSMVVLSSCTNYDDQFDDLNSQINSLKSQIEGFSSLSSGLTALQGTVSSLQSAVAALPKTATPATDISGLEASVAALQTSLASASTSAEVTAITTQLTAAQAALADAIAANATAADANATSIAGNATAIANLLTELETLATSLTAIKADLAAADTSAEVTALTTALAAAQADLTKLLEQNKIYTGDVIISNASTLAAVEALGDKVSIVNGNVYITQSSTAIDATKLQAVVSKMTTVTGAVSYTHSGTGVTAVNFDKLASAGSISLVQDADISLASLTSVGAAVLKSNAVATKLTSVSAPVLATVTSFNNGTANTIGGANVVTLDLGSLVRYPQSSLGVVVKSSGDTTIDLAALTTKAALTGLETALALTLTGGDDLSLPLMVTGTVSASNVKTLTLPKFIFTGSNLTTGTAKLETLAAHEVRASLDLTSYTKLTSVDIIGTIDASTTNRSVAGGVILSGNANLTTASFKGLLNSVDISGAGDLSSVTTAGMIRSFRLNDSDDLTSLTLGHAGVSGVTNTGNQNASNRTSLKITSNDALTSFTAEEIASLGTLHITGNSALTAFTLKSTLSLGTALDSDGDADAETVDVQINNNALSGSVQLPSDLGVSPVVTGKITQASLSNISAYLKAAEAAIKTPALLTSGAVTSGWDYDGGTYAGTATSGGVASTAFASVDVDVDIDVLTSSTTSLGVVTNPNTAYDVIDNTIAGSGGSDQTEKMAAATTFFSGTADTSVSVKGGTVHTVTSADLLASSTQAAELVELTSSPIWSQYGITGSAGIANKRTQITIAGTNAVADVITVKWGALGQYSFTYTVADTDGDGTVDSYTEIAGGLAKAWNAYNFSASTTSSATITDAMATNTPKDGGSADAIVRIYTGTNSGTTDFLYNPFESNYYDGLTVTADNSTTAVVTNANDFYVTATATVSSTSASNIALLVSGGVISTGTVTGTTNNQVESGNDGSNTITVHTRGTDNAVRATAVINAAAVSAVNASITKRATWL